MRPARWVVSSLDNNSRQTCLCTRGSRTAKELKISNSKYQVKSGAEGRKVGSGGEGDEGGGG